MLRSLALTALLTSALCAGVAVAGPGTRAAVRLADARPAVELKAQQEKTDQALALREKAARASKDAARARDKAAASVARLKQQGQRGPVLESALQQALAKDEAAARARSAVAAADADVAREGARLLRLYDAVLAERRRAVDAAPAARRQDAVDAYRALVAHRDAVRAALAPVLAPVSAANDGVDDVAHAGLDVGADDDVEALLEKADLARDLEARLLRRADAVRRRIAELKDEASLEGDVADSLARGALFDEEDRRLAVTRSDLTGSKAVGLPVATSTTSSTQARAPEVGAAPNDALSLNDPPPSDPGFVAGAVTTSTGPQATAERPLSLPTELATSQASSSLTELQALDAQLQKELAALQKKQAALKKAAADRAR